MSKHYSPIVHVKLTTTQRDAIASPESGMEIYNITSNQLEHYNGSAWVSGGGISTLIGLTDTPNSYGTVGQVPAVNSGGTGLEWVDSVTSNSFIKAGLQGFFAAIVPTSTKLILMVLEEEIIFETNAPQSKFKAITAPSGAVSFDIRRITAGGTDSSIGSIDFANGATDGTVTITAITIPIGDIIYIQSPADVLGLADLFINLVGKNIVPLY